MSWKAKKHDKFWKLAKEQGFRSRASFKLIQLNKKYGFLGQSKVLIDLCAAPGGWLQVAAKYMPVGSNIIGVDLLPIKPIRGVKTFVRDITTEKCKQELRQNLDGYQADVVLHDGAPNVGGSTWTKDAFQQLELVLHSMRLATDFLKPGGMFLTKVFRSQDYNALLWVLKQFFKKIDVTKPSASRNTSAEIYCVCQGFLAPKKYDPKLLEASHVFKQVEEEAPKPKNVLHKKDKQKRNRGGYDAPLYQEISVSKFVESAEPVMVLSTYNCLKFDEASKIYEEHELTTDEIKRLCEDLKVLGRGDFASLVKWRKKMVKHREELLKEPEAEKEPPVEETEEQKAVKVDQRIAAQLESDRQRMLQKDRAQKKKKSEDKRKQRQRMALNKDAKGLAEDITEEGLFSMASIKDKDALDQVQKAQDDVDFDAIALEDDDIYISPSEEGKEGVILDEAGQLQLMEENIDNWYQEYQEKRKIRNHKKARLQGLEDDEEPALDDGPHSPRSASPPPNPLLVDLAGPSRDTPQSKAARWFQRDAFSNGLPVKDKKSTQKAKQQDSDDDDSNAEDGDDEHDGKKEEADEEEVKEKASSSSSSGKETMLLRVGNPKGNAFLQPVEFGIEEGEGKDGEGFEIVGADESPMSSDTEAKAETLAIASSMLRKKNRLDILDSAYNRYNWDDSKDLPDWFRDDEARHNKPLLPVTKDQMDEFRERLKDINTRPIKKIAEAKARKKQKALKRWEKIKTNAETIANSDSIAPSDKIKQISKLYKKQDKRKLKQERVYMVSNKGGGSVASRKSKGKRGKVKLVDPRLKKDTRAQKRADKRKGGRKAKGGGGKKAKK